MQRAGGRDLETMLAFAEEKLGPYCSGTAMHVCTRPQKKTLKKFMKMSEEERESLIAESDDAIAAIEAKAKEEGDAIQAEIKQLTDEHTVCLHERMHMCCRVSWPAATVNVGLPGRHAADPVFVRLCFGAGVHEGSANCGVALAEGYQIAAERRRRAVGLGTLPTGGRTDDGIEARSQHE